jgi:hypothetical protein
MKIKFIFLIGALCFTFSSIAQDSEYELNRVMSDYFKILKNEGYAPIYDKDDDIKFKIEGSNYFIMRTTYVDAFNMSYYIENKKGCTKAIYQIANYATKQTRYANATVSDDCSLLQISCNLHNNNKDVEILIDTAIRGIKYCKSKLNEKYDEFY